MNDSVSRLKSRVSMAISGQKLALSLHFYLKIVMSAKK